MADKYIKDLNDYPANTDGYIAVGALDSNGGGKKLLSEITPDASQATPGQVLTVNNNKQAEWLDNAAIPPIPSDSDTSNYVLGIVNGELDWVELETESITQASSSGPVDVEYKNE